MRRHSGRGTTARPEERGVVFVIAAITIVLLLVFVAFAVDLTAQVNEKHQLHDSLDTAAHAGAFKLPADVNGARTDALAFAAENFPDAGVPTVDFWCVVGALPGPVVNSAHIPTSCKPGPAPYTAVTYPGLQCSDTICAIPCSGAAGTSCNTIRVADSKLVPYNFAPVIGIEEGSTGTMVSAACRGACGTLPPNPIDFAVVADRTSSMAGFYDELGAGMQSLLKALTPSVHHVALGTISMSRTTVPAGTCPTSPASSVRSGTNWVSPSTGTWMPVGLRSDYQVAGSSPVVLNTNSPLVRGVNCIAAGGNSGTGTWLAAPLKAAADYLVANGRAEARKVMLFETDGEPNEETVTASPFGNTNGNTACTNAKTQATNAKSAGILVVTIAFRLAGTRCDGSSSGSSACITDTCVTKVLASMASPKEPGVPSEDDGGGAGAGCNTAAKVAGENSDGDFFFCTSSTPTAADLQAIYQTAASQATTAIRLIKLP